MKINNKKNVLVLIDPQLDFIIGSLAVNGAEKAIKNLVDNLNSTTDDSFFSEIVFTQDWHVEDHPSFIDNGGEWPKHCVQNSFGASLPYELIEALSMRSSAIMSQVLKGRTEEEYGAFNEVSATDATTFRRASVIYVAGIAGDYCVKESVKQLIEKGWGNKIVLLTDCIASIDKDKFNRFVEEENLKTDTIANVLHIGVKNED